MTVSFDVSLSQYVKTNTGGTYQPFTVTAFHSTKIKHLLNRTKVYNNGFRIKIEGAVELYNNTIYCELQHSTFVIPKNNTANNDKNSPVSPSSSRRAAIVRSIAEHTPPTKKPKLDSSTSLSSTVASESESSSSIQIEDDTNNEDVSNDVQCEAINPNKKKPSNTSKSRRATLRDLSSRKLA